MSRVYDIAVVGSAFGGSLIAMIARRLGRSVILIERDQHPRFAIGESTTPLSNLLLESLARRFDLPRLLPLTKWGSWQRERPELAGGLKRGFTFLHHRFGQPHQWDPALRNELLVAASPTDAIADTQWYRPDVDHFFQQEAVALGAEYCDQVELTHLDPTEEGVTLRGTDGTGAPVLVRSRFLIDASGPRGFLHRHQSWGELSIPGVSEAEALFTHFTGVDRWDARHPAASGVPFPADDAALHHVFPGGWMWVLRFNQGITSAGVSVLPSLAAELNLSEGAAAWERMLQRIPSVAEQFAEARPTRPFTHVRKMSFRGPTAPSPRWTRLPSAMGFVDPLLSTGFALNLLGVERIATALERGGLPNPEALAHHEHATESDLLAAGRMIGALQAHFERPAAFSNLLMLYFAAASYSETARRLGRGHLAPGFLLHGHPEFGPESAALLREAVESPNAVLSPKFVERIQRTVARVDVGGWFDPGRDRWHPVETAPLFRAAASLESSAPELEQLLRGAGFPEAMCSAKTAPKP